MDRYSERAAVASSHGYNDDDRKKQTLHNGKLSEIVVTQNDPTTDGQMRQTQT